MSTESGGTDRQPGGVPTWARQRISDADSATHEATYISSDGRRLHFVAGSAEAIESAALLLAHLEAAEQSGEEHSDAGDVSAAIERATLVLTELVAGHDALDVMSMVRQYLVPPDLSLWPESHSQMQDSWACAEVVALVLLGADLPKHQEPPTSTAQIIPELVEAASAIVRLAEFASFETRADAFPVSAPDAAIKDIAWRLRSYETTVRGRQYASIAEQINEATLRRANADTVWRRVLGFDYDDVLTVRESLIQVLGAAHEATLDRLAEAAATDAAPDARTIAALRALFQTPSVLYRITADQVAAQSGLDPDVATRVLDRYSIGPDGREALGLLEEFVAGRNPIAGKGIIKAPGRGYLVLPGAIAPDEIRRTAEGPIAKDPSWAKYGKGRDAAAEAVVNRAIRQLTHNRGELYAQLRYRAAPRPGQTVDLSASSTTARQADSAEADALLVLDGVALCIEVKAGSIKIPSRQGRPTHLRTDLKETIQKAASQADRLRTLITTYEGLWLEDGAWLDLSGIHELHSVVVNLDDLGPAALDIEALVRSEVLPQTFLPWIVSVHDLLVIAELLDRPEQFLTYLRRRTNRDSALWVSAVDELDIVMWFIQGGFYFEPDPDRLYQDHPGGRPPTAKDRKTYREQGRTIVGTFTDPLDAWYYYREGSSSALADRPTRPINPFLQRLIEQLAAQDTQGWWRASADLDGLSARAQDDIAQHTLDLLRLSAVDGQFHTYATGGSDDTGRWLYIFATGPNTAENRTHLSKYLQAKKHLERADRATGLLLRPDGSSCMTLCLTGSPGPNPVLDLLARDMRLIPSDRAPRVLPPRAKPGAARRKDKRRGKRRS